MIEAAPVTSLDPINAAGKGWKGALADFIDVLTAEHIRNGCAPDQAADLAHGGIVALAMTYGGRSFYLPTGEALRKTARNHCIFKQWNGRNKRELMQRYEIRTARRFEQIIAEQVEIGRKNHDNQEGEL